MKRNGKRILSVKVKRMTDTDPDTSYFGEYSNHKESEYSIDRAHAEDCASVSPDAERAQQTLEHARQTVGDLQGLTDRDTNETEWEALEDAYNQLGDLYDEVIECDCGERGDMGRHEYRYFNPSSNYVDNVGNPQPGNTPEDVRKYTRQDYERMEDYNRGGWCYLGIRAEADVQIVPQGTIQRITSGGLWGIESDSGESYLKETADEELAGLREQLLALGFSRRAISVAFKSAKEVDA